VVCEALAGVIWAIYSRNSDRVESTPELFVLHPDPKQLAPRHETPKRALKTAPAGLGLAWMDQLVPFHASARVRLEPPVPETQLPAPVQEVSVGHETSWKTLAMLPEGLGVLWSVQVVTPLNR
jgi:hypothetical protein